MEYAIDQELIDIAAYLYGRCFVYTHLVAAQHFLAPLKSFDILALYKFDYYYYYY